MLLIIKLGAKTVAENKTDYGTPWYLFERISAAYGPFDIDAAAEEHNCKVIRERPLANYEVREKKIFERVWLGPGSRWGEDALTTPWSLVTTGPVWLNPPWGTKDPIMPWLDKAIEESDNGLLVVMLLPWGRWAKWHEKAIGRAEMVRIIGRVPFLGSDGKKAPSPPACNILAILRPPIEGVHRPVGFTGATIDAREQVS
jgi:hypothetical protein